MMIFFLSVALLMFLLLGFFAIHLVNAADAADVYDVALSHPAVVGVVAGIDFPLELVAQGLQRIGGP